jgi:hypothetical protein
MSTNQQESTPHAASTAAEGDKAAQKPLIDVINEDPKLLKHKFVNFVAYGKVINAGMERPPSDFDEPRLWTLTDDTSCFLSDKKSQAGYDEYLHIGCNAVFDSCANAVNGEGLDAISRAPHIPLEHAVAVALIRAGQHTHAATEEAALSGLGCLRLTMGGQTSLDSDRVFAELAHERFGRPLPTAVYDILDSLRQAFVDRTLEVSMHAASKAASRQAFAKSTVDRLPEPNAKIKKAAADKRKAAVALVITT